MAQKITGYIKLQIPAGKANLSVLLSVSTASISWRSPKNSMKEQRTIWVL